MNILRISKMNLKRQKEAATKEPLGFFDYLELEKEN